MSILGIIVFMITSYFVIGMMVSYACIRFNVLWKAVSACRPNAYFCGWLWPFMIPCLIFWTIRDSTRSFTLFDIAEAKRLGK